MSLLWLGIFLITFLILSFQRAALSVWAISFGLLLIFLTSFSQLNWLSLGIIWTLFIGAMIFLLVKPLRRLALSSPILRFYLKAMPSMSRTEREALAAGSVTWEGELFCGNPQWEKLLAIPKPSLTPEEQAFLDGPVDNLCKMIDDWQICYKTFDLPPVMWEFIKKNGFFGLIIPKQYGGKEFSAYAHSQILTKIYSRSGTVATTVSVPNSLGPAELLLHYGTPEQKDYYLPRLASGEEIPCFALTGPDAGSDASAMPDYGVIGWGEIDNQRVLGMYLTFNKRYITLAPVATVIGLAFKLYDPDHLHSAKKELGITCALIPRDTPGLLIGRRHFPIDTPFQNGPIEGKNIFIPLERIIGGPSMAGQGWRMLMECLAAGRAISLPSSSIGGAKMSLYAVSAYARVRRQFKMPIGQFEGVAEVLARVAGYTYMMDATRLLTAANIDLGEKPAVASAITKYHVIEMGRQVSSDVMDIHGGKAICLGPKNYLARVYTSIPIAITVEGANILTRSMIIFGQGAMRCHPYLFAEFEAAHIQDAKQRLKAFDNALFGHLGYSVSNMVRSFILALKSPFIMAKKSEYKQYFAYATRFSAAFALIADLSLLSLGGAMKRKESISGRLGDILSDLYILSAVLKHYTDEGSPLDGLPLVHWTCQTCLYNIQRAFVDILQNFPNPSIKILLKILIFPLGKHFQKPCDKLGYKISQSVLEPSAIRTRLTQGAYLKPDPENLLGWLEDALHKAIQAEPIEKIIRKAVKDKIVRGYSFMDQARAALSKEIISQEQFNIVEAADIARHEVIAVDDFAFDELAK